MLKKKKNDEIYFKKKVKYIFSVLRDIKWKVITFTGHGVQCVCVDK